MRSAGRGCNPLKVGVVDRSFGQRSQRYEVDGRVLGDVARGRTREGLAPWFPMLVPPVSLGFSELCDGNRAQRESTRHSR